MKKMLIPAMTIAAFLVACSGEKPAITNATADTKPVTSAAATHEMTPEQLGELGAQISKQPDRAQELLSKHNLDMKKFESEIREVTESPDASKRYAEAYRRASV